ncbi:hypothetical protein HX744_25950 [Pseudonocardia sp. ICBG1122]|nr:hypothetical protein [Pseudonocardia pini]
MGEIVWAGCVSHTGSMLRITDHPTEGQQMRNVYAVFEQMRESLAAARPDAVVVVSSDHFSTFSYDLMPVFTVGRGASYRTWGEFGSPQEVLPGHEELAEVLYPGLVDAGFDVCGAVETRVDHGCAVPLHFLDPEHTVPVVPLLVNGFIPPLPSMSRCLDLGASLRALVADQDVAGRVAVVATGGVSHWIGVPETGRVGEEFDRWFLDVFERGDLDELRALDDDTMVAGGGGGSGELRCWMVALGAGGGAGATTHVYFPSTAWITGIALTEVKLS